VSLGGSDFLGARAALCSDADLENVLDMLHLRGAADRARKTVAHAVEVVTPVDMRIDLDQGDRAAAFIGAQHRYRDCVIAAEDYGQCTGLENLAYRLFGPAHVILEVMHISGHVAAIDRLDRLAEIERAADVKIVALHRAHRAIRGLADGCGRAALLV